MSRRRILLLLISGTVMAQKPPEVTFLVSSELTESPAGTCDEQVE